MDFAAVDFGGFLAAEVLGEEAASGFDDEVKPFGAAYLYQDGPAGIVLPYFPARTQSPSGNVRTVTLLPLLLNVVDRRADRPSLIRSEWKGTSGISSPASQPTYLSSSKNTGIPRSSSRVIVDTCMPR